MYHHIKTLMYTVRIGTPDPAFGNMLLEQFGGANGELAAAMQAAQKIPPRRQEAAGRQRRFMPGSRKSTHQIGNWTTANAA